MPALIVLSSLALLAILLLAWAIRGKRIDDHPLCRKCRFDLVGLMATGRTPPARCPECGCDLAATGLHIGNRRRRRRALNLAIVLLVIAIPAAAGAGYLRLARTNIYPYLPTWALMWRYEQDLPGQAAIPLELMTRVKAGAIDAASGARIMRRLLAVQADQSQQWIPGWGALAESLIENSLVTNDDAMTFLRQGVIATLLCPKRGRAGGSAMIGMKVSSHRLGPTSVRVRVERVSTRVGSRVTPGSGWSTARLATTGWGTHIDIVMPDERPGTHPVEVIYRFTPESAWPQVPQPEDFSWTCMVTGQMVIVPQGTPLVSLVYDEGVGKQLLARMKLRAQRYPGNVPPNMQTCHIEVKGPLPTAGAFHIYFREPDGKELRSTRISFDKSLNGTNIMGFQPPMELKAQVVDIIFRADEEVAISALDVDSIWGGQIVFPGVNLRAHEPIDPFSSNEFVVPNDTARIEPLPPLRPAQ